MAYVKEKGVWWFVSTGQRYRAMMLKCKRCGKKFPRYKWKRKDPTNIFCSRDCANKSNCTHRKGPKHHSWKGGRKLTDSGYIMVICSGHPRCDQHNYVSEHRLVMEKIIGRYLLPHETVHHKNGVRDDNRPENLELWSKSHPAGQRVEDKVQWAKEMLALYEPGTLNV